MIRVINYIVFSPSTLRICMKCQKIRRLSTLSAIFRYVINIHALYKPNYIKILIIKHANLEKKHINTYLNLPIFLRCENISPPGIYSRTIYKLLVSYIKPKNNTKKLNRTTKLIEAGLKNMHFKAGGREVETIATDTVTQCSKNGKISVIFKKVELYPKKLH